MSFRMRPRRLLLLFGVVVGLLAAGCGGATRHPTTVANRRSSSSSTASAPVRGSARLSSSAACSDPVGICAAVQSAGIAPRPVNALAARSVQTALEMTRRDDLAASLYNLLHGHHQRVSAPSCQQAAVFTCTVWVTPIREQLSIAIACKQVGAGTHAAVNCVTHPLDFTPVRLMSASYPGIQQIVVSHGYTLAGERCDDPWGAPVQILDPAGLTRTYHCLLLLAKPQQPVFSARAVLWMALAQSAGGWQLHVLDLPGLQGAGHPRPTA